MKSKPTVTNIDMWIDIIELTRQAQKAKFAAPVLFSASEVYSILWKVIKQAVSAVNCVVKLISEHLM